MNTSKLKLFAKEARLILVEGAKLKLQYWGFNEAGETIYKIQAVHGGYLLREDVFDDSSIPKKWEKLETALKNHSFNDIVEEAAYTWFNRLIAIKILEQNKFINPVYCYTSDTLQEPVLLSNARRGLYGNLTQEEITLVQGYLLNHKDEEAFAILLTSFCKHHQLTNRIFGQLDDYTELLIPSNLLAANGIISLINNSTAITDEDYKEVELIGWLYQFYISDKKDEIFNGFKKNKKARAEDLPAATQIFTPKWIVKYMVCIVLK